MKNNTHLRLGLFVALLSILSLSTLAQGGQGQRPGGGQGRGMGPGQGRVITEEMVTQRVDRLAKDLELSEEQKNELNTYEIEMFKKNQVERQKLIGDREAMRAYMLEQRKERDAKYKEIFTEEQYLKLKEIQNQRRSQRPGTGPEGSSSDRPARGRGRN